MEEPDRIGPHISHTIFRVFFFSLCGQPRKADFQSCSRYPFDRSFKTSAFYYSAFPQRQAPPPRMLLKFLILHDPRLLTTNFQSRLAPRPILSPSFPGPTSTRPLLPSPKTIVPIVVLLSFPLPDAYFGCHRPSFLRAFLGFHLLVI